MYEDLTRLMDAMETDTYGEIIIDTKSKGTMDDPIHMPYAKYTEVIGQLWKAIYDFSANHPEYNLKKYRDILVEYGLNWKSAGMKAADVANADGQLIMALLYSVTRMERFCEGALLMFCEEGYILRWLKRLKEIDEGQNKCI